jgi:hypothetical protein
VSKWIDFELLQPPDDLTYKPKTKRWIVQTKQEYTQLGIIRWCCGWRKYAFYPYPDTLYEQDCLRDIADFIDKQMKERKGLT